MSKIIYVSIAILIYMIINLFITIKKNTKILHFAGSVLFLQFFLLSAVNSHFITLSEYCNGVQREHNKKLNNGLPILHKVPPKRDYGRYFCIMAEKGGTSHGGLTEKSSPIFHAQKQEVNAYGR